MIGRTHRPGYPHLATDMTRTFGLFIALLAFSVLFALPAFRSKQTRKWDPRQLRAADMDLSVDYSNILPADYVGPQTCAECHEEQYDLWHAHPHSRMNRNVGEDSVQADFNNAVLKLPTGEAHFVTHDGQYFMDVFKDGKRRRRYQVTKTVGSRYMQAFIGKQIAGPEPANHDIYKEHRLPFGFWFKLNRWVPRVFMNAYGDEKLVNGVPADEAIDGSPRIDLYAENCMNCHNTFPYAYRIFHEFMVGFPDATVSANVHGLADEISKTIEVGPTIKDFVYLNERLNPEEHLVTMGVSCESCHFGGREHAVREREIKFLPTSKLTRISADDPHHVPTGGRENAYTTRGICTQCHSGAADLFPNGAGKGNSREGLDLFAGHCASQLSCIDCHEPHTGTRKEDTGIDLKKHIDSCASCHTEYLDQTVARAHAGPGHEAVNCLDCHMPKFTRGVDHLIRTHRISMPVEENMVAAGMANACNACHLDKTVRWTLDQTERIWGQAPQPSQKWAAFETLDEVAGDMWLHSKDSHMRYLATQWLAGSRFAVDQFAGIANSLNDPEPVNRVFAIFAVSKLLGQKPSEPLPVDISDAPRERQKQIRELIQLYESKRRAE